MITINKLSIIFIFFTSCSVYRQEQSFSDCEKFNIETETSYNGHNNIIIVNISDFNEEKSKSLDIVRILNVSGSDTNEDFKYLDFFENFK